MGDYPRKCICRELVVSTEWSSIRCVACNHTFCAVRKWGCPFVTPWPAPRVTPSTSARRRPIPRKATLDG